MAILAQTLHKIYDVGCAIFDYFLGETHYWDSLWHDGAAVSVLGS